MFGILNKAETLIRTEPGPVITLQDGDFGWAVDEAARVATINDAAVLSPDLRAVFGVYPIKPADYDSARTQVIDTTYQLSGSIIDIVDGYVVENVGTENLSPDATIKALRGGVDKIKASKQSGGIVWSHEGVDYAVASDADSRAMLSGSVLMANLGAWNDLEDSWTVRKVVEVGGASYLGDSADLILTSAELVEMATAVGVHAKACHKVARTHKSDIDALVTWADVDGYDPEAGWPAVAPTEPVPVA